MINGLIETRCEMFCQECRSTNVYVYVYDYGVDSETGWHDTGEILKCEDCGAKEVVG